jgi:hypothetical protein
LPATEPKAELYAVAALERWLERSDPRAGLRSFDLLGQLTEKRLYPTDVARILRRRCAAARVVGDLAGHSLRRGFITNAAKKKVAIESIKARHRTAIERDRVGLRRCRDDRRGRAAARDRQVSALLERGRRTSG